jgi:phospholipid/cholesterol/gamma-HCH transport system permease protein
MQLASLLPLRPVAFLGQVLLAALAVLRRGARFAARDLGRATAESGARALGIVTIVNLLVGAILAFVGAVQLMKFGAGIFVADLVGIAVARPRSRAAKRAPRRSTARAASSTWPTWSASRWRARWPR